MAMKEAVRQVACPSAPSFPVLDVVRSLFVKWHIACGAARACKSVLSMMGSVAAHARPVSGGRRARPCQARGIEGNRNERQNAVPHAACVFVFSRIWQCRARARMMSRLRQW